MSFDIGNCFGIYTSYSLSLANHCCLTANTRSSVAHFHGTIIINRRAFNNGMNVVAIGDRIL